MSEDESVTDGGGVERTRVGHCKADETDVYVGRGPNGRDILSTPIGERGWLGNPYTLENHHRGASIAKFREDFEERLERNPEFRRAIEDLAGKTLGCWCQQIDEDGPSCHGEVIAEYADRLGDTTSTESNQEDTDE